MLSYFVFIYLNLAAACFASGRSRNGHLETVEFCVNFIPCSTWRRGKGRNTNFPCKKTKQIKSLHLGMEYTSRRGSALGLGGGGWMVDGDDVKNGS